MSIKKNKLKVRVLVVDDSALFRSTLVQALSSMTNIEVAGEAMTTDGVRNIVIAEVNRNKRSVRWTVAPIEVAGEAMTTDGVRNIVIAEVNRNKRSARWAVAPIEVAEREETSD